MGMWVAIAIVLFVLGSMMALKPSGIDQRLDKLRMTARCLQLNPKLVACPDWVRGKNNEYGRGMLGQYGMVFDNVQLPLTRYRVIDGQWRPDTGIGVSNTLNKATLTANTLNNSASPFARSSSPKANFNLDKTPLALPASIEPFVKALLIKANSIVIYWEDIAYVRPITNPGYKISAIEPDLLVLKGQLEQWALQMQKAPHSNANSNSINSNSINDDVINSSLLNKSY